MISTFFLGGSEMKKSIILILFLAMTTLVFGSGIPLSLSHLESLKRDFELDSKNVTAWWIYSNPDLSNSNEYVNGPAKDEGAVCVDDASRAVVLYLQLYEETKNINYLKSAKSGLEFLMEMEGNDGEFYNFVYENGEINRYGITSKKSVSWWTLRGFWALSMGAQVFKSIDIDYSAKLSKHAFTAYEAIKGTLKQGLVLGYSDMSSIFLIGLSELYTVSPGSGVALSANEVAKGILETQLKRGFMDGAFFTSKQMYYWNGWGARQVQALALAGRVFKNSEWIKAAEYSALHFYPKLIFSLGPIYSMNGAITSYPQISYANEVMVSGLTELYISTKKEIYADMAYMAASWYFHNNHLGDVMYTKDGKGYDGMEKFFRNINSGAESTICADMSLSDLMKLPDDFSFFLRGMRTSQNGIVILNASKMYSGFGGVKIVRNNSVGNGSYALLSPYSTLSKSVFTSKDGNYDVYISCSNTAYAGKINIYLDDKQYRFTPQISQRIEFAKALPDIRISKGKHNVVVEYIDQSSSAKIGVAQIILVPHVISQTISSDGKYRLTSVINKSDHALKINDFMEGKPTKARLYNGNGTILNSNTIPKGGFAFIEWPSTKVFSQNVSAPTHFEKTTVAATADDFVMINLSKFFNNLGVVSIHSNVPANFDNPAGNAGAAYPLEFLKKRIDDGLLKVTVDKRQVPFYVGKLSSITKDNMTLQGQKIGLEGVFCKKIFILGSSDHGNYIKTMKIFYLDGTSEEVSIGLADWFLKPLHGEWTAFTAPYGLNSQMQRIDGNPKIYVQQIKINSSKKLIGIKFPTQITMHIFAITLLH